MAHVIGRRRGSGAGRALAAFLGFLRRLSVREDTIVVSADDPGFMAETEGEWRTAAVLARLPDDYVVFDGLEYRGEGRDALRRTADQVVVGRTGVFLIDGKGSVGRGVAIDVDAPIEDHIRQAKEAARDLKAALARWSGGRLKDVWVVPVVVYAQPGPHSAMWDQAWREAVPLEGVLGAVLDHDGYELEPERVLAISRALFSRYPAHQQARFRATMESAIRSIRRKD